MSRNKVVFDSGIGLNDVATLATHVDVDDALRQQIGWSRSNREHVRSILNLKKIKKIKTTFQIC